LAKTPLPADAAEPVATALELGPEVAEALTEFCNKGEAAPTVSKEPLQYRFQVDHVLDRR